LTFATVLTLVATPAMLVMGAGRNRQETNWLGTRLRLLFRRPVAA
jgi:hypothetical protein